MVAIYVAQSTLMRATAAVRQIVAVSYQFEFDSSRRAAGVLHDAVHGAGGAQ